MKNKSFTALIALLVLWPAMALALLNVKVLKSADNALPIAITDFIVDKKITIDEDVASVIRANLQRSGRFKAVGKDLRIAKKSAINFLDWRSRGVEAIAIGEIKAKSSQTYTVVFRLFDVYSRKQLLGRSWVVRKQSLRRVGHKISDAIYETLLGEPGDFDTHLSYITVKKNSKGKTQYSLEISDSDAHNAQTVLVTNEPILSPAWSPDGKKLAYVSFEKGYSQVYIKHIWVRRKREVLPKFDGIASSPVWSPDGKKIALTLSKNGNKDIYLYTLKTKRLKRLTKHKATDTEASFSSDGRYLVFSSDRSNGIQIYRLNLASGDVKRLSYKGNYNAKPVYSPSGKQLVMVHRENGHYRIALLDLKTRVVTTISKGSLDESPYFSPHGHMVIYATKEGKQGILSVLSTRGLNSHQLMSTEGEVREPSWSSF